VLNTLLGGKYQINRLLGEGGMGAVYEAIHTGTGRRVAVKVINTSEIKQSKEVVARFHREARATGAIDSRHIAMVLDVGEDPQGALYMVMEYLQGEDLQELLQKLGPLPTDLALRIAAQACLGLQKAHEAGVVHRDIKPANIFITHRDGEIVVKILDFGVAKVRADQINNADLTRTGSLLGTPYYVAPEQAKGQRDVDHRADIWSLGVVLYTMLTGRPPHHHLDTFGALIIAICTELPKPVQHLAPWVSPEVAAIVHHALQFDPANRFQHATEMLEAIKPLINGKWTIDESMLVPLSDEHAEIRKQITALGGTSPSIEELSVQDATPTVVFHTPANPLPALRDSSLSRETSGSRDLAQNRGVFSNRDANLSREGLLGRDGLSHRNTPLPRAAPREASALREAQGSAPLPRAAPREASALREAQGSAPLPRAAPREASAMRETSTFRETSGQRDGVRLHDTSGQRDISATREGTSPRDGAREMSRMVPKANSALEQILKDATSAYLRRDYELALKLFEECLTLQPDDRRALHNIERIKKRKMGA